MEDRNVVCRRYKGENSPIEYLGEKQVWTLDYKNASIFNSEESIALWDHFTYLRIYAGYDIYWTTAEREL